MKFEFINSLQKDNYLEILQAYNNIHNKGNGSVSVGWGKDNICKGDIGAYIVIVERGEWDGEKYPQIGEPKLGKIDGEILKADTWYTLKNGEFIEVTED